MLHRIFQSGLIALLASTPLTGPAAPVSLRAEVVLVEMIPVADIVLLSRGFDAGLRQGMVCHVTRSGNEIAEILLVDVRPNCASAMIVAQSPSLSIRSGDFVSFKTLKV